ncbi:MAG: DNA repair protein RecN [Alphaproteobacteria bacterium]|nr:DNA repair protein RecN [Alphaproteobacteria bacterium]MBQ8729545.1 DNA repair protein RecN [Alphaproteobacteria bacterium]
MLVGLNISNIVLIERLNLEFGHGLNVLTGETGAGKSILMDALSLALGARSDVGLIRHGCDAASVTAEFDSVPTDVCDLLREFDIDCTDGVILRRTLSSDGKSRAWINDVPVSIKTLHSVGDLLVEIHGQFANHTLLNQATHRPTLDAYGLKHIVGYAELLSTTRDAYMEYHAADKRLDELTELLSRAETEREFLAHNVAELQKLNPVPGEEEELSTRRAAMMNAEKNAAILTDAMDVLGGHGNSLDAQIFNAAHILQRIKSDPNPYTDQIDKLYSAAEIISNVMGSLEPESMDMDDMDSIEERLFAIRAAARKHRVGADELPDKLAEMTAQLSAIDNSDAELKRVRALRDNMFEKFQSLSQKLSSARMSAADKMRESILAELPDLKLGSADFRVKCSACSPSTTGCDDVTFMIKTNPGSPFAPLHRAASGGELARLMLALRVVFAGDKDAHTFVFDEVDTGISGATASAVGSRLNRLASASQALVITHSAQVAGFADKHFKISKTVSNDKTTTSVIEIGGADRVNEIARIISGAEITTESITMAKTLIKKD